MKRSLKWLIVLRSTCQPGVIALRRHTKTPSPSPAALSHSLSSCSLPSSLLFFSPDFGHFSSKLSVRSSYLLFVGFLILLWSSTISQKVVYRNMARISIFVFSISYFYSFAFMTRKSNKAQDKKANVYVSAGGYMSSPMREDNTITLEHKCADVLQQ